VDARNGIADRLAEPLSPRGDQVSIVGEFFAELGRRFGERPARVERVVPAPQVDVLDEAKPGLVLGNLAGEEAVGIPAVKDVADVEDDGGRRRNGSTPGAP
jgi:hypothetical protein